MARASTFRNYFQVISPFYESQSLNVTYHKDRTPRGGYLGRYEYIQPLGKTVSKCFIINLVAFYLNVYFPVMSLGETSKLIGCSLHIQQPAAANLYRKC